MSDIFVINLCTKSVCAFLYLQIKDMTCVSKEMLGFYLVCIYSISYSFYKLEYLFKLNNNSKPRQSVSKNWSLPVQSWPKIHKKIVCKMNLLHTCIIQCLHAKAYNFFNLYFFFMNPKNVCVIFKNIFSNKNNIKFTIG